jgi:MFS family permease
MNPNEHPNQFALLRQRRFAPFFWVQFLGAANDNLFKFAFTVLVTYQLQVSWLPPAMAGLVIGAVFILPYLLFSATSGQLADKLEKAQMIRAEEPGDRHHGGRRGRLLLAERAAAAGLPVPDGAAEHGLRPGEVRLPAAAPERA